MPVAGSKPLENLQLSVIIPTLNAAARLPATLAALSGGLVDEIIVADGGSTDAPIPPWPNLRLIRAPRGRGSQLAAGVAEASGDWLLLLHADTILQPGWQTAVGRHVASGPGCAGYFRFNLDSESPRARRLERRVAWRCRVMSLPYGDQGLLIHRDLLAAIGGVPTLPLMEDVAMVRRLGWRRLAELTATATTSALRWEREGWHYRSMRNFFCLSLYLIGFPPRWIVRLYA